MTRRGLARRRSLVAAALAVLLAGCSSGSGGPAGTSSRPSRSASPVGSPTATSPAYTPPTEAPPPVPASSPDTTRAAIFVLAWFETLNYGFATGDADPLREAVSLGCFTCANWIIEVQTQTDRDLRRDGGSVHVRDLVLIGPVGDDFRFRAVLNRDPGELIAPDGARTPVVGSTGEVVDLTVGLSPPSPPDTATWLMKAVTAPTG